MPTLFPMMPPTVTFTGPVLGSGLTHLRDDAVPGMTTAQRRCCGFIRLSSHIIPGVPSKTPFQGYHPFQVFVIFPIHVKPWGILCKKMADRPHSQFESGTLFTCSGKVAGLLDHALLT